MKITSAHKHLSHPSSWVHLRHQVQARGSFWPLCATSSCSCFILFPSRCIDEKFAIICKIKKLWDNYQKMSLVRGGKKDSAAGRKCWLIGPIWLARYMSLRVKTMVWWAISQVLCPYGLKIKRMRGGWLENLSKVWMRFTLIWLTKRVLSAKWN